MTVHVLSACGRDSSCSFSPQSDSSCTVICQPMEETVHGVSAHEVTVYLLMYCQPMEIKNYQAMAMTVHVLSAYVAVTLHELSAYGSDNSCTVMLTSICTTFSLHIS